MRADPIIPAVKRTSPRTAVRRLALGRFISYTGTVASGTALSYSLYAETGSAAWVAAAMISRGVSSDCSDRSAVRSAIASTGAS